MKFFGELYISTLKTNNIYIQYILLPLAQLYVKGFSAEQMSNKVFHMPPCKKYSNIFDTIYVIILIAFEFQCW